MHLHQRNRVLAVGASLYLHFLAPFAGRRQPIHSLTARKRLMAILLTLLASRYENYTHFLPSYRRTVGLRQKPLRKRLIRNG